MNQRGRASHHGTFGDRRVRNIGRTRAERQCRDAGRPVAHTWLCSSWPGASIDARNTARGGISMTSRYAFVMAVASVVIAGILSAVPALAQHQVATRSNVAYVEHDGVKLTGDLYMPKD